MIYKLTKKSFLNQIKLVTSIARKFSMQAAYNPKEFIPTTAPVHQIACSNAFNQLNDKE